MLYPKIKFTRLLIQLGALAFAYTLCRVIFIWANANSFPGAFDWHVMSSLFLKGMVFDVSAICMTNLLFVFLALLPFAFASGNGWQSFLKYLYVVPNSLFLLSNLIDAAYFPFIAKRMQADALLFVTGEKGSDFFRLLPSFILEYWYLWLIALALAWTLWRVYAYSLKFEGKAPLNLKTYALAMLTWVAGLGLTILGFRGGTQVRPLDFIHAAEWTDAQLIPALLNTPFSVLKSLDKKRLTEQHFFPEEAFSECEKGVHQQDAGAGFQSKNVVIIIVESLSREYVSYFKGKSKTPFLDSLFAQSLVFSNGFANAKESIQGIPAILASIPSLQNDPFIFSPYSGNKITSVANLLKPMGYTSSFFHGGRKGTMGFDAFAGLAGFETYYSMENYPNEAEYDGHWGIWDEPFLGYMADELSRMPQPFISTVFTLNTHHPFTVPPAYTERFKMEGHPILGCVQYVDYALEQFFKKISQAPWYRNALFVITADHTGPGVGERDFLEQYRIPIVFYAPDGSLKARSEQIAGQIDILPTLMHLLNYPKPFFSMGKDLLDPSCEPMTFQYSAGLYTCLDSTFCLQFNGQQSIGLYDWQKDPLFSRNLCGVNDDLQKSLDGKIKKCIQLFNGCMIHDKMLVK